MKKLLLFSIALFSFAFCGIFTHFYNRTDDLSLRYNLWKIGLYPYPSDHIANAIIADRNGEKLIRGKTKEQIKQIFPTAHEDSRNEYQKMYEKELVDNEYLWLGDMGVVIILENGVGKEISIMKG
ncbi:MAG TPA: hypothetical protein PKY82_05885 [Pyrinomonadaceae bacterium]|nr:hypothetical protein [Pyrinomonadaceae bacterium]